MYTVYHFPYSQHGRRVISLLEEAQLPYRVEIVDLSQGQHLSADYLRINPNHQVPSIADGDFIAFESNAILRFLCNKHGLEQWYPSDVMQRAIVDQWLDWIQCQMSPAVVGIVLNSVFLKEKGDQQAIQRGIEEIESLSDILEKALQNNAFLSGVKPTIADLALASNVFQLGLAEYVMAGDYIASWYAKMMASKGFKASLPASV